MIIFEMVDKKIYEIIKNSLSTVIDKPKNVKVFLKYLKNLNLAEDELKRACYQVIGDIILLKGKKMKPVLLQVKKGNVCWNHCMFVSIKEKIQEHDDYLVHPFEVVEGIAECNKCGSRKTWSFQKQTRASDEPMTTFTKCAECGESWKYSG